MVQAAVRASLSRRLRDGVSVRRAHRCVPVAPVLTPWGQWPCRLLRFALRSLSMDDAFHAILDSLPPKRRQSKLEPYAALIRELRNRRLSYREITTILRERCGVRVGLHTVYHFVRGRARHPTTRVATRSAPCRPAARSATPRPPISASEDRNHDVWSRIAAVKGRGAPSTLATSKEFEYDENEPLHLIADRKTTTRK